MLNTEERSIRAMTGVRKSGRCYCSMSQQEIAKARIRTAVTEVMRRE